MYGLSRKGRDLAAKGCDRMRIATWNCKMGFKKKADAFFSLMPDIAVVPECSEVSVVCLREQGYRTLWFGSNPRKGLGVICSNEWEIRAIQPPEQEWIVPIEVKGPTPFTLIAVWACRMGTRKADCYVGLVYRALKSHPEFFAHRDVVIAGDLNSNRIWDDERAVGNHSAVVALLREHGLVSGYHQHFNEAHGEEKQPTFYLHHHLQRAYHLDYIFVPQRWVSRLSSVAVGEYSRWSHWSDHCPMVVDLRD
jgi:endonuclease/exonuclease/phosphatase family metal-dependent hydrolase